jgi:hypothetical protein
LGTEGGSTNVVSDKFIHAAILCILAESSSSAPNTTATGFPKKGFLVNTSTCLKANLRTMISIFYVHVQRQATEVSGGYQVSAEEIGSPAFSQYPIVF